MENYLGFEMRWDECDFLEGGRVWAVTPGSLYGVATVMDCPMSPRLQLPALPCVVSSQ